MPGYFFCAEMKNTSIPGNQLHYEESWALGESDIENSDTKDDDDDDDDSNEVSMCGVCRLLRGASGPRTACLVRQRTHRGPGKGTSKEP